MTHDGSDILARMKSVVGDKGFIAKTSDMTPYLTEWRDKFTGVAAAIVRPSSTQEVSAIVKIAAETGTAIVPQSGNTGLVGGQIPDKSGDQIVLSLDRMTQVRSVDEHADSMIVDAGCLLENVHQIADDHDRQFPLDLASRGSARIGGLLSTNAGGINVLRYGTARDQVLGLEVVLPDGEVWDGLRVIRKDNTGYDLKHLFMGAEGTLGIITGAALKLYPKIQTSATGFVAVPNVNAAIELLARFRSASGDQVSAFELIPRFGLELVLKHIPGCVDPLAEPSPWYVLVELTSASMEADLNGLAEKCLEQSMSDDLVTDAVLAQSKDQEQSLWHLRESLSESQKPEGGSIKHDISVPIAAIGEFLKRAGEKVAALCPGIRPCPFGHLGDGNIHYNLSEPVGADTQAFLNQWQEISAAVHDIVHDLGGSISAEHGIGQLKREDLVRYKDPVSLVLMRQIKATLDPQNIMNPGKVL